MKSDSEETGYAGEDEASVISDDELETENEEITPESSSNNQESDEDSEIGQNENIWLDFLNEVDPEQENGKLKTVKKSCILTYFPNLKC